MAFNLIRRLMPREENFTRLFCEQARIIGVAATELVRLVRSGAINSEDVARTAGYEVEADAIARSQRPVSFDSLSADLTALGLLSGDIALVHTSLSALGWVCGGPLTVIQALLAILGPRGPLVMPALQDKMAPVESRWNSKSGMA